MAQKTASFDLRGNRDLRERLDRLARQVPEDAKKALGYEAGYQMGLAQERTPFLTGALAGSARSSDGYLDRGHIAAAYGFGGAPGEIPYVFAQHFKAYAHDDGERKWLTNTARRSARTMLKRLAHDLRLGA